MDSGHIPVLLEEVLEGLAVKPNHWYVDLTFGRGGHTSEILKRGGKVIALDQDEEAIVYAQRHFVQSLEARQLIVIKQNFEHLREEFERSQKELVGQIAGVLADLGVSSNQLDEGERGFSFQHEAPLDMRMSTEQSVTAKDLVNGLGKKELYALLTTFAQEHRARIIVDAICRERVKHPIETTTQLARIIEEVAHRQGGIHPATKTFMALRMLVNDELGVLERMLPQAFELLAVGGRLAVISFHEGEDRLVKQFERQLEEQGKAVALSKKPITASERELSENPRSRSAKLRMIERTTV